MYIYKQIQLPLFDKKQYCFIWFDQREPQRGYNIMKMRICFQPGESWFAIPWSLLHLLMLCIFIWLEPLVK
jgi:hypothetical protein